MRKLIAPWNRGIIDPSKSLEDLNANDALNFEKIRNLLLSNDGTMNIENVNTFKEIIVLLIRPNMYGFRKFMEYLKQQGSTELRKELLKTYNDNHSILISP